MDLLESLAPSQELKVVSNQDLLIRWYKRRGYREVKRFSIATMIPLTHLKRTDLDFVVMRMGEQVKAVE